MIDRRFRARLTVGLTALLTATTMAVSVWLTARPTSRHPALVTDWYQQHASAAEWQALLLAVSAVGVVAFATGFRELTWTTIPQHLWTGTVMVLAALGYAALASVAAAVDLAILLNLPGLEPDVIAFGASVHTALLAVATPAIVVVMLGASPPLVRSSLVGTSAMMAGLALAFLLAFPPTWTLARHALPLWFVLVAATVAWPLRLGVLSRKWAAASLATTTSTPGDEASA